MEHYQIQAFSEKILDKEINPWLTKFSMQIMLHIKAEKQKNRNGSQERVP